VGRKKGEREQHNAGGKSIEREEAVSPKTAAENHLITDLKREDEKSNIDLAWAQSWCFFPFTKSFLRERRRREEKNPDKLVRGRRVWVFLK